MEPVNPQNRAKGWIIAAILWCIITALVGVAYKFLVHPYLSNRLKGMTSSPSQYKEEVVIALDSFSGYCVLRSDPFRQQLKTKQIKLTLNDDKADYEARLKGLISGKTQMATFTIDSLIAAGSRLGDFPCSIVLVLDETKGGDAIVAMKSAVPSVQSLDHAEARIVLTPASPSEFLARVMIAHFNLPRLPEKWAVEADGAAAVYKQFRAASKTDKRAFVLWEPYISKALEREGAHVLLDSSKLKGYVVDVLVAQRQFLKEKPELVQAVVEAYLRASFSYSQDENSLLALVQEDIKKSGLEEVTDVQAKKVVSGIHWKNTMENYAHFGLVKLNAANSPTELEDMIHNITDVLIRTKAIPTDPLSGKANTLYYDNILAQLKDSKFHPGQALNILSGVSPKLESVAEEKVLSKLTDEQWGRIQAVGELRIEPIGFLRGSATLSSDGERELAQLAARLKTLPGYYLKIIGHTRSEGDPEANRVLAQARAEAVGQYLLGLGIHPNRIRMSASEPSEGGGQAQIVSFLIGQSPY